METQVCVRLQSVGASVSCEHMGPIGNFTRISRVSGAYSTSPFQMALRNVTAVEAKDKKEGEKAQSDF